MNGHERTEIRDLTTRIEKVEEQSRELLGIANKNSGKLAVLIPLVAGTLIVVLVEVVVIFAALL